MTVVDASVLVSALVDSGSDGRWAETEIRRGALAGPELFFHPKLLRLLTEESNEFVAYS